MKVKVVDRVFNPITIEVTFETRLELDQLFNLLESSNEELNSLLSEKIDFSKDNWLETLHDTLDDLQRS